MLSSRFFPLAAAVFAISIQCGAADAQNALPRSLDETGQISIEGRATSFRIRNLPVSSFPDLPQSVASELTARGCVIPQTYQAKRPENVIHASFERPGSTDWAVLCSEHGRVSLLIFMSGASEPMVLETAAKTARLQPHGATGELGFNWGIDPASPGRIHDAQAAMPHRPPPPDHDCLADTTLDRATVYHLYRNGAWETVPIE
jgi:hypothetical protein